MENNKIFIGKILKNTRSSLGLTQEEVAEKLNLAPRYISDIERDKSKGSIDTLVKLCNIYKITPTFILQDYLDIKDEQPAPELIGFYQLKDEQKEIIKELISFMNKQNK